MILKIYFLREQFWKFVFERVILKMHFLREQFWKCIFYESTFENKFFEGACLLLIRILADWSELRFQFRFIQTYKISVFKHLNLSFSFYSPELMRFQFWSKLRFQFRFIWCNKSTDWDDFWLKL